MKDLLSIKKNDNSHSELDSESINLMDNKELALIDSGSESGMTGVNKNNKRTGTLAEGATHVGMPPIIAKAGFTLAEVLITLGIIGVVAAMTIPNLITGYQKKATVTKLQKAISTLNQAYKLSYDEYGDPEDAFFLGAEEYFKQYWAPFIKVLTYCTSPEVCGYETNTPFKDIDGTQGQTSLVSPSARTTFLTPDGFLYIIFTAMGDGHGGRVANREVYVDINGGEKPNLMGRDLFILTRVDDKGILPYGYQLNDHLVRNVQCTRSNGRACAERIKRAGWQIDKSYPWK